MSCSSYASSCCHQHRRPAVVMSGDYWDLIYSRLSQISGAGHSNAFVNVRSCLLKPLRWRSTGSLYPFVSPTELTTLVRALFDLIKAAGNTLGQCASKPTHKSWWILYSGCSSFQFMELANSTPLRPMSRCPIHRPRPLLSPPGLNLNSSRDLNYDCHPHCFQATVPVPHTYLPL